MPEGQFCNRRPINTDEDLKILLGDKGGKQYYAEMEQLDVDTEKLWAAVQKTCKSRTLTWLEICAHCGMCANSCFLYRCNDQDPEQVPAFKIQSTLGEIVRKKGQVDNAFMRRAMDYAWSRCTCCNRCGQFCPHGIDVGVMNSYLRALDTAALEDPAGLVRMRAQMLRRIQMVTGDGRVRDLLITEFVLN